jgi:hypothetical protein
MGIDALESDEEKVEVVAAAVIVMGAILGL